MALPDLDASPRELSDEGALLERARAGDGLCFRRLVEPHLPMLHRVAARVCGDRHLAFDAVQETLLVAWQRLDRYRHELPFRAYLAAIAARQAHTLSRSERRRAKRQDATDQPEAPAGPEDTARAAATAARVREALLRMPDKRRDAAILRLDAGLSYKEVAHAVGSTEGSARVLVHTALEELRQQLADLIE
jgi:RNA polymerase sigma-70 factor (ECF subfamily)